MPEPLDPVWMQHALRLAMRGRGQVEPNPMVGCIIVKAGRDIGQGWHQRFGQPHAEPNALASCTASPAGATAYVTLEPCCHTNKKTPPCTPALIQSRIARIVIACSDPNPAVAGQGIAQLRSAGIAVETDLLETEAKQLNAPFFAHILHHRPYITLKWAESADGKVAGPAGQRRQISNGASMRIVHELRSRSDAILVGIETVLQDDPLLTVRGVEGGRHPMRVVLDSTLRTPREAQLVRTARNVPTIIFCSHEAARTARADALRESGVRLIAVGTEANASRLYLPETLRALHAEGATHVLVEGGPTVSGSFIRQGLADRVWIFRCPGRIGSPVAPDAPACPYPATETITLDTDRLTEYLNPASAVFFALAASADLHRTRSSADSSGAATPEG